MSIPKNAEYLGDGLYAHDDGMGQIGLFCDRHGVTHEVYLDPYVLQSFFLFIERKRKVKITITEPEDING